MEFYVVVNNPVVALDKPGAIGRPVNAYPVGTKLKILKADSGWLMTESGSYIFKNQDIITFREYKKAHINDLVMTESIDENVPQPLRKGLRVFGGTVSEGDLVKVSDSTTKDINSGALVPADWCNNDARIMVESVDGTTATIIDKLSGKSMQVPVSSLEIYNPATNEYQDASTIATAVDSKTKGVQEFIAGLLTRTQLPTGSGFLNMNVDNLRSIFGMPYQYLPWVDNRLAENSTSNNTTSNLKMFGRKYAQKIAARAPILVMQAGRAQFMRGWSKEDTDVLWKSLANVGSVVDDQLKQLVNTPGKYYSLKVEPGQYFEAVTQMCWGMASLLGLRDTEWTLPNGETKTIGSIKWNEVSDQTGFGYYAGSVGFYINSEPQINEAFSNGTTQSQLAQKINEIGRMASEIQFYLGGITSNTGVDFNGAVEDVSTFGSVSNGGLFDSIVNNIQTIIAGGRMIFPEIWADHTFTRSYSVTIKLDSPDCDTLSIYMNILVPLAHILAFVMPRSIGNNNYISPFLVKAFYKSMFHIDMGIITDCQITKGDVGAWTQNGLPTQVTVNLTIKDLYNVISLATGVMGASLTGNPGQLDYIANMCGINIDAPSIERSIKLWWAINNPIDATSRRLSELFQAFESAVYMKFYDVTNRLF